MDLLPQFYQEFSTPAFSVTRLRQFLERGLSVNHILPDGTPLLTAMWILGNRPVVRILINEGANPLQKSGSRGLFPFLLLIDGDKLMLRCLFRKSLSVNQTYNDHSTLLHYAVKGKIPGMEGTVPDEMVDFLLEIKPNLEIENELGETPLLLATKTDAVLKLVDAGAKKFHRDHYGRTIRDRLSTIGLMTSRLNNILFGRNESDFRRRGIRQINPDVMDDLPEGNSSCELVQMTVQQLKLLIEWYNKRALVVPMNKTGLKIELISRINSNVPRMYINEFIQKFIRFK